MQQEFNILKLWELRYFFSFHFFSFLNSLLKLLGVSWVLVVWFFFFPQDLLFWWQFSNIPVANQPSGGPCPC